MKDQQEPLQSIALFSLRVSLWSGRKKLQLEDFESIEDDAMMDSITKQLKEDMPREVISLGSKRIFPRNSLRKFNSIKYRAEKALKACSFRTGGCRAVPCDQIDRISEELNNLASEFEAERSRLKGEYSQRLQAWADDNPRWKAAILHAAPSAEHVCSRMSFRYRYFFIVGGEDVSGGSKRDLGGSLIDELLDEIKGDADEFWKNSIKGRDYVPRSSHKKLIEMAKKLQSFSFVDPRLPPMVKEINKLLGRIPEKGRIVGDAFSAVNSMILMLCEPSRLVDRGEAKVQNKAEKTEIVATATVPAPLEKEHDRSSEPEPCFLF